MAEFQPDTLYRETKTQAHWDAEWQDPYREFYERGVYGALSKKQERRQGLSFGMTRQTFGFHEAQLLKFIARDSEVLRRHFEQVITKSPQPEPADATIVVGRYIADSITDYFRNPIQIDENYTGDPSADIYLEAELIASMMVNPQRFFTVLGHLADRELKSGKVVEPQQLPTDDSWAAFGQLYNRTGRTDEELKKQVMARLVRPHLVQLEHVVHASKIQRPLEELLRESRLARWFLRRKILPYPHIPENACNLIEYQLQNLGFERVRGYQAVN